MQVACVLPRLLKMLHKQIPTGMNRPLGICLCALGILDWFPRAQRIIYKRMGSLG